MWPARRYLVNSSLSSRQMSRPRKRTAPLVGGRSPAAILPAVVLPEPLSPTRQTTLPGSIASETSSTAVIVPRLVLKTWLTRSRASRGSVTGGHHLPLQVDLLPEVAGAEVPGGADVVERRVVVGGGGARVRG